MVFTSVPGPRPPFRCLTAAAVGQRREARVRFPVAPLPLHAGAEECPTQERNAP